MSSKTPTKQDDEIESAPKKYRSQSKVMLTLGLCIAGSLMLGFGLRAILLTRELKAPGGTIKLEWLDTAEERIRGLSGRERLDDDRGLLFVFERSSAQNCFWMKDMKFSIDMVWLDEAKRVVTVAPDVSPDTFPEAFCPKSSARYGLEITAGRAKALGIDEGIQLSF